MLAPENTLAAFKIAADSKAEYAELDVQETKDGQLVITHDSNLKELQELIKMYGMLIMMKLKNMMQVVILTKIIKARKCLLLRKF